MKVESKILIVEDQPAVSKALSMLFELHGLETCVASGPEEALAALRSQPIAVVIQDMNFQPGATNGAEGAALFRRIRELEPGLPILLLTAWTSLETAVELVKEGATDYLAKPWDDVRLLAEVRNLLTLRGASREGATAPEASMPRAELCGLIHASEAMREVLALALRVSQADVPVLITGPNGTGKEMVAEVIRANSGRRAGPFVKVNVAALPDALLESELFGAEAGAYTGAGTRRIGRFEAADKGTLLLDEIGNLSASGQSKLLRVLQSGEFERLGSNRTLHVDVRVICATNADLRGEMEAGRFREDLYYRLNVIEIHVPPLHQRREDVLPLAEHFMAQLGPDSAGRPRRLSPESRRLLLDFHWPGNVRELENRILRAGLVATGEEITPADLGLGESGAPPRRAGSETPGEESERRQLEESLSRAGGVVSRVAEDLGISRQALYRRMHRLGIVLERRPRE